MQQGDYLKIPEVGDRGTVFCPAISENFEALDQHKHNGVDSPKILSSSLEKSEVVIPAASFVLDEATGDYKYNLTLPAGYAFDTSHIRYIVASGDSLGREIFPTIVKAGDNDMDIYVYKNDFDVQVVIF